MAVTSSNIPSAEKVPATKSTLWQEEMRGKDHADGSSGISPAQSPVQGQAGAASSLKDSVLESKEGEGQEVPGLVWHCSDLVWAAELAENYCRGKTFLQVWFLESSLLCRDRSKVLQTGVWAGKKLHHMLENHNIGPRPAPGEEGAACFSAGGKTRQKMPFVAPLPGTPGEYRPVLCSTRLSGLPSLEHCFLLPPLHQGPVYIWSP